MEHLSYLQIEAISFSDLLFVISIKIFDHKGENRNKEIDRLHHWILWYFRSCISNEIDWLGLIKWQLPVIKEMCITYHNGQCIMSNLLIHCVFTIFWGFQAKYVRVYFSFFCVWSTCVFGTVFMKCKFVDVGYRSMYFPVYM